MKMEENTNDEIRGRSMGVDLDEPFLCEEQLLHRRSIRVLSAGTE